MQLYICCLACLLKSLTPAQRAVTTTGISPFRLVDAGMVVRHFKAEQLAMVLVEQRGNGAFLTVAFNVSECVGLLA